MPAAHGSSERKSPMAGRSSVAQQFSPITSTRQSGYRSPPPFTNLPFCLVELSPGIVGEGGLISFAESSWLASIVVPHQPHFMDRPQIGATHDESADEGVSQIMPSKITDLCISERCLKPFLRIKQRPIVAGRTKHCSVVWPFFIEADQAPRSNFCSKESRDLNRSSFRLSKSSFERNPPETIPG